MKNAMNFRPVGLMLLFCLIPLWAFAQSVMVKGVVKDTSGEAIIGASVLEKGTTNGTITDFDGNFALNVSKNAVLVVSFVGYKNEEIPVAGKSSLGEFYQFNLSSCIRQQNSLTAQFVSFSLSNLANIFYPPNFYNN